MIVSLAGGVGAARFLQGLALVCDPAKTTVVANTADDMTLHGLYISPDLDTLTYTLAGASDPVRGWGLQGETFAMMAALRRYDPASWFNLGDADLATHLYRTGRMAQGASLSEVTAEVASAWGLSQALVPMTDVPVRTWLTLAHGQEVSFQDYFVRLAHAVSVTSVRFDGAQGAQAAPGVLGSLDQADAVIICPSNPILSIAPILSIPGVARAVEAARERCVAISPIVAGAAIKGPAARLMVELGEEPTAVGIARRYAPFASVLVVDEADAHLAEEIEAEGIRCHVAPSVMDTPQDAARLAEAACGAVGL